MPRMGMWIALAGSAVAAFALQGWWGIVAWAGLWLAVFGVALATER